MDCRETNAPAITFAQGVESGTSRIGEAIVICFTGFDVRRPLTVVIKHPNGQTTRVLDQSYVEEATDLGGPDSADRAFQLRLLSLPPEAPPGRHELRASQEGAQASASFRLLPTAASALWVVPSVDNDWSLFQHPDVRVGDPIQLVLTAFPPNRSVPVHIYGGPARSGGYVTTVRIRTDGEGHGAVRISTSSRNRGYQLCPVPD